MPLDRSTRTLIAAFLWVAAAFIIMNNIISGAEPDAWLLPLLFVVAGAVVYFLPERLLTPSSWTATDEATDTQVRSDALAAVGSPAPEELQDPVENMLTTPTVSLEETDEVASPPTAYIASPAPEINAPTVDAPVPATLDQAAHAATAAPEAPPAEAVTTANESGSDSTDTQERSDAIAAVSDTAPADLQDPVENMQTTPTATLQETDEVSSAPTAFTASPAPEVNAPTVDTPVPATLDQDSAAPAEPEPTSATAGPVTTANESGSDSTDTQERSDAIAAVSDTAPAELQDPVDNMQTTPIASLEETDEVSGPPGLSISQSETTADNLTLIEGIGSKMSAALIAAGITSFAQLAEASEETLRSAISAAGMRFSPSLVTWAEQAAYAARGDFDGLRVFQQTLSSGRRN